MLLQRGVAAAWCCCSVVFLQRGGVVVMCSPAGCFIMDYLGDAFFVCWGCSANLPGVFLPLLRRNGGLARFSPLFFTSIYYIVLLLFKIVRAFIMS